MLLCGAAGLRDLRLEAAVGARAVQQCCLLSQLTRLDIDSFREPVSEADLNVALRGLASVKELTLNFAGTGVAHGVLRHRPCDACCQVRARSWSNAAVTGDAVSHMQSSRPPALPHPAACRLP